MNSSHNQGVTATAGGASSIPTPANSGGSGLFGGASVGATHGEPMTGGGGAANGDEPAGYQHKKSTSIDNGRRRSSQHGGPIFGNISNLKRGSQDQGTAERKAGFAEQTGPAQSGILGKMWNNITTGSGQK